MKKYIVILSVILLASCEDVIDLDLKTVESMLVIEGNIYDHPGPYTVRLSKTVDFDEPSNYPPVSDALVVISDNHGTIDTLTEKSVGIYETTKIEGKPGYTYNLTVVVKGIEYVAKSIMPAVVPIDSIYFEEFSFGPVDDKQLKISFKDPLVYNNYYRIVSYSNGIRIPGSSVTSDYLSDGDTLKVSVSFHGYDEDMLEGELVTVELQTIDKGVYDYFRTIGSSGGIGATPTNPISNISNGVLGYFNAASISSKGVIFQ